MVHARLLPHVPRPLPRVAQPLPWERLISHAACASASACSASDAACIALASARAIGRGSPPYGDFYFAIFEPATAGPEGTFPSCTGYTASSSGPCYAPGLEGEFGNPFEGGPGLSYALSAFDANGIATGQMDTLQGIVPLVVKNCL
jgi:hypothetical protein